MDSFADEIGVPREYFSDLPRQFNLDHIIYTLLSVNHPTVAKYVNIPEASLKALILSAREIVVKEKSLLSLSAPIKICGDIHGQYYDLLRLFDMGGFPPESKYLFLGDYVDRGNFSIECIVLLLCYKVKYPDNIFLLRGNHECAAINRLYGFFDECFTRYSEHLWKLFIDLFRCLPISAVVEDKIFCTHGGLSPHLVSLKHIRDIERPTEIPESGLLCDLLWADPSTEINRWGRNDRGISCTFGEGAVTAFLDKFDFDLVVRAHQVVPDGYEVIMGQKLVTVFSAPNYCGEFDNAGAILCVDAQLMCSFSVIRPRDVPMVIDYASCVRRYPPGYSQRLMMRMREGALEDELAEFDQSTPVEGDDADGARGSSSDDDEQGEKDNDTLNQTTANPAQLAESAPPKQPTPPSSIRQPSIAKQKRSTSSLSQSSTLTGTTTSADGNMLPPQPRNRSAGRKAGNLGRPISSSARTGQPGGGGGTGGAGGTGNTSPTAPYSRPVSGEKPGSLSQRLNQIAAMKQTGTSNVQSAPRTSHY